MYTTDGFPLIRTLTIALLSDTHGQIDTRLHAAIRSSDQVVHAGDIGGATVLEQLGLERTVAVRGNNDVAGKWPPADRPLLQTISEEARVPLPGGDLVVVHGHRAGRASERHHWLREKYSDARLVVYGHSHRLIIDTTAVPWVVNPGAAGYKRTYGGPSCLLLHIQEEEWNIETVRPATLHPLG